MKKRLSNLLRNTHAAKARPMQIFCPLQSLFFIIVDKTHVNTTIVSRVMKVMKVMKAFTSSLF